MISTGLALSLGLLVIIALGSGGYLLSKKSVGMNRSLAMTIVAYGMLSSSLALVPLSIFHIHGAPDFGVHIHWVGETVETHIEECGLPVTCTISDVFALTGGVLMVALILNLTATRLLMRGFRKREDRGMTLAVREDFDVDGSIALLVVKDSIPDAFSFAVFEKGKSLVPRMRDVLVITSALIRLLDRDELRTVIAHEVAHVRKKDNRYAPFFHALSSLVFFDPLIKVLKIRVARRQEFIADREAALSTGNPLALARALMKILVEGEKEGNSKGVCAFLRRTRWDDILERIKRLIGLAVELGCHPGRRHAVS